MKQSIRFRYTLLFAGLVGGIILIICLANSLYLGKYYVSEKAKALVKVYGEINEILNDSLTGEEDGEEEGGIADDTVRQQIAQLLEESNISAVIVNDNQNYWFGYENQMWLQMQAIALGKGGDSAVLIKDGSGNANEKYVIYTWNDSVLQSSYILFFGYLEDTSTYCFFRISLPAIHDNVVITTRFTWCVGVVALIIGILIITFAMKRISDPVKHLSQIADRMAHLDFSARYEEKRDDEIELLGVSMNHMAEELEKTIDDLKRANEQLQADIKEKDKEEEMNKDFISNVSHELKTPIALVQGYAEGLLEGMGDDPESMTYYCEVIVDEADKMNRLVRSLLTLNQIESGVNKVDAVDFDLARVIEGVLRSFAILIQQNEITVEFEADEPIPVRADEFMMEEVVRNYISNAINHIDGAKRIYIMPKQDEEHVRISVYNTGMPIPENALPNVWDKFYKVDKARTREYGGSGIGLSIVKAVMESHHGSCGVYNTSEGVCFWFELQKPAWPAVQQGPESVEEEKETDEGESTETVEETTALAVPMDPMVFMGNDAGDVQEKNTETQTEMDDAAPSDQNEQTDKEDVSLSGGEEEI